MALVTRVTGDCPKCGRADGFGKVEIFNGSYVYLGCKSCRYSERIPLPKLRKKVLYLDQFFFSHAFRGERPEYLKAAELIRSASALQLLVAPYSSIHEDETHLWQRREELFEFIKDTSRGHKFRYASDVEKTQMSKAFRAWLNEGPAAYHVEERDALRNNVHQWDGYMRVEVGRYLGDIELIRELKGRSVEGLVDLFPGWRTLKTTFEQHLNQEYLVTAKGYFDAYREYFMRMVSGDADAFLSSPVISLVVQGMLRDFPSDVPEDQRLKVCVEFMTQSEHFRDIPSHYLSSRIYATVKDMVRQGSYAHRDKTLRIFNGFFHDVKHISTYAPYCDAFVMDTRMADIVKKPSVDLERKYGTMVFSENNWGALIAWLEALPAVISDEHKRGLVAAYG